MAKLLHLSTICVFLFLFFASCRTTTSQTRTARVIAENASLRDTPSTTGLAESEVPEGVVVKVLDEKLPWYAVRVGDRVGWMHGATLHFIDGPNTHSEREPERVMLPTETSPITQPAQSTPQPAQPAPDRVYVRGPRGGCYYLSSSGRKVYVDHSMCN